jgi:hypothetical protein
VGRANQDVLQLALVFTDLPPILGVWLVVGDRDHRCLDSYVRLRGPEIFDVYDPL